MAVTRGVDISKADLDDLATLATAKLSPATDYAFSDTSADWLTTLSQIRTDLFARYRGGTETVPGLPYPWNISNNVRHGFAHSPDWIEATDFPHYAVMKLAVSDRQCVKVGDTLEETADWVYDGVEFWHPRTTGATLSYKAYYDGQQAIENVLRNSDSNSFTTSLKWHIRIGGTKSGKLKCSSKIKSDYCTNRIYPTTVGSSISVTTDLPGVTVTITQGNSPGGTGYFEIDLGITGIDIDPGLYTVEATCSSEWHFGGSTSNGGAGYWGTAGSLTTIEFAVVEEDKTENHAIHNTFAVDVIYGTTPADGDWPFGVFWGIPGVFTYSGTPYYRDFYTGEIVESVYPDTSNANADCVVVRSVLSVPKRKWWSNVSGIFIAKTIPLVCENAELDKLLPWTKTAADTHSTMRNAAPGTSTDVINKATPAINYRVARYPLNPVVATGGSWTGDGLGFAVFRIVARRAPVDNGSGIFLAPDTGAELVVHIYHFMSDGTTKNVVATVTIPTTSASALADVLIPVFTNTQLLWEVVGGSASDVVVQAYVNDQPPFVDVTGGSGNDWKRPWIGGVLPPIAAMLFNDTERVLNLM